MEVNPLRQALPCGIMLDYKWGEKIVALYLDLDSYPQLLIEHAGYEAD